MSNFVVGDIVEGKVTGIKSFGAFVQINDEKQGLVHISEIAHGFVKDINDVLSVGEEVKVKIMKIEEESGRISLSIRATQEAPERPARSNRGGGGGRRPQANRQQQQQGFNTLEEKLKEWLKQSNEIQADLNKRAKR